LYIGFCDMLTPRRNIAELVRENILLGQHLFSLGIKLLDYSNYTLEEACKKHGLNPEVVINTLESAVQNDKHSIDAEILPISVVVRYLKHKHFEFVKKRLPFVRYLIHNLRDDLSVDYVSDLKMVYPLFEEDFIQHIYEEEDTVFRHILLLNRSVKNMVNISEMYYSFEKFSLSSFVNNHHKHPNEMEGIRQITLNFNSCEAYSQQLQYTLKALKSFYEELEVHANIEDNILLPRAIELEKKQLAFIKKTIRQN
jgi:regulator of cell morphogenesis and NO signaling